MITVLRIDTPEGLAGLKGEWNRLLERCGSRNIFMTFEWMSCWWEYFGQDKELYVLVARDEGQIAGISPLMVSEIKRFGIRARKLEFIGMPLSDYSDFIIPGDGMANKMAVVQAFCDFLRENRRDWDLISLNRIEEDSSTLKLMRKARKPGGLFSFFPCDVSPRLIRQDSGSTRDSTRDRATDSARDSARKPLGRSAKRLIRDGGSGIISCRETGGDCAELLEILFKQHVERWADTPTPSIFNDGLHRGFFSSVVPALMRKGESDILYLPFRGKPSAFLLVFMYNDVFLDYLITNDSSIARYSPGRVLLELSLDSGISRRYGVYDFLRGGHKYKFRYANRINRLHKVIIHRNLILFALDCVSSFLEFRIKQDEKLHDFFMRFEKRLRIF